MRHKKQEVSLSKDNSLTEQGDFSLLDNSVINLIIEKTKLDKEKYSLILSKTVIIYVIIVALAMFSAVYDFISSQVLAVALGAGTLLLFVVYLYVIEHFAKMDRDLDEVISLLQTKAFMRKKQEK